MPAQSEVASFIRATFRSVWSLELLCFLRKHQERSWTRAELVSAMRASELVVGQSVEALLAAGLVMCDAEDQVRYQPVSDTLDSTVAATEKLYARSPNAVRRMIIGSGTGGLTAFADAFKLRKD